MEEIRGTPQEREKIRAEFQALRDSHEEFLIREYPAIKLVKLSDLLNFPIAADLIQPLVLQSSLRTLRKELRALGADSSLDPERVFVGTSSTSSAFQSFGGFHEANQGYRYMQGISVQSLLGCYHRPVIEAGLTTLDLIRGLTHDSLHHTAFRLYRPRKDQGILSPHSFYQAQYGFNFRDEAGNSYSAKDPQWAQSTRNLGLIMEGCVDRFAQEFASRWTPPCFRGADAATSLFVAECLGRETTLDASNLPPRISSAERSYLSSLELFHRSVTCPYRQFILDFDSSGVELHEVLLRTMITGNLRELILLLDRLVGVRKTYVKLFRRRHDQRSGSALAISRSGGDVH
jgi:hypothetical protein